MFFCGGSYGNRPSATLGGLSLLLIALGVSAHGASAQTAQAPQPSGPPVTTLSITAREVLLDVVVTDGEGRPVTGLTSADFSIMEEGDLQRLTHLEEHHPMGVTELARLTSTPALPPNAFTNFTPMENTNASTVILLDALDTSVQTQMMAREQLIDFVKHMPPGTPIAIFQIDTEMRLIQGFSADPQVLLQAVAGKRDMVSLQKPIYGTREQYRRVRLDILRSGFRLMGRYLAGFPGRKNLIWLTGSIPQSYLSNPIGTSFGRAFKDDFTVLEDQPGDLMDELTLSRVAVYPIDARGLDTPPIYSTSVGGRRSQGSNLSAEGRQAYEHMDLENIAQMTGGKAFYNTNGLKESIAAIVNNGSSYYTLAYSTTNTKWEGQFRHIKATLDRPNLHLQYRQGYYAVDRAKQEQQQLAAIQRKKAQSGENPFGTDETANDDAQQPDAEEPLPPENAGVLVNHPKGGFEASMQLGAIPPTEIVFVTILTEENKVDKLDRNAPLPNGNYLRADYKGKPFRTYGVQIKSDTRGLRLTRTADGLHHGAVEFVTVVYNQTGNQVNSLKSMAELNLTDEHYRQMLAHGISLRQEIAVPVKGNYFLRIGVHDIGSDHIGTIEIPVDEVRADVSGQSPQKP
jgi:VWFA-related protein